MADLPAAGARAYGPGNANGAAEGISRRAAAVLSGHPWVEAASVDADGVLRVRPADSALATRPGLGPLVSDYLEQWTEVYDWVYEQSEGRYTDDLDLSGWHVSGAAGAFPVEHMTEWIDRTVELVLASGPRLVLELGCGTGLLLHRLREQVAGYVGTDVSRVAVDRLSEAGLPGVVLVEAAAHDAKSEPVQAALETLGGRNVRPDCVLLNSVTQHFPSVRYLETVVHDAIDLVSAGGTVVIGDVRHAGLLGHYCAWLERSLDEAAPAAEVERRAEARARREKEFLADPPLIAEIAARNGRAVTMTVHAKTMRADTELTRYRYDVVLHVDSSRRGPGPGRVSWSSLPMADRPAALRRHVAAGKPVLVHSIPNRLLASAPYAAPDAVSAFELRSELAGLDAAICLDADDPFSLSVAVPSSAALEPGSVVSRGPAAGLAHEPFERYVAGRLPEVLLAHLRGTDPALAEVVISVE